MQVVAMSIVPQLCNSLSSPATSQCRLRGRMRSKGEAPTTGTLRETTTGTLH